MESRPLVVEVHPNASRDEIDGILEFFGLLWIAKPSRRDIYHELPPLP